MDTTQDGESLAAGMMEGSATGALFFVPAKGIFRVSSPRSRLKFSEIP